MRYQSTTGLAVDQIAELAARIWQIVQCREEQVWPATVGLHRAVVITLVYVRQNLNQVAVGDIFGISQSTVPRIYRGILPLIGQALCLHVPALKEAIRGRLVLVDGTDVPTGNRAGHEDNYSGKRHRAGLAVQVLSTTGGDLLAVSTPCAGSTHDREAFAQTGYEELLADIPTMGDLGYLGTSVITPRRKPRGGELSDGDKESNGEISAIRKTDTFLGERYRRIARRHGKKKAIVAVGRSILVIICHLLADPEACFKGVHSLVSRTQRGA